MIPYFMQVVLRIRLTFKALIDLHFTLFLRENLKSCICMDLSKSRISDHFPLRPAFALLWLSHRNDLCQKNY